MSKSKSLLFSVLCFFGSAITLFLAFSVGAGGGGGEVLAYIILALGAVLFIAGLSFFINMFFPVFSPRKSKESTEIFSPRKSKESTETNTRTKAIAYISSFVLIGVGILFLGSDLEDIAIFHGFIFWIVGALPIALGVIILVWVKRQPP